MPNFVKSLLAGFCILLASCSGGEAVQDAKQDIALFHQRLDAGDIDAIWKSTSGDLNESTTLHEFGAFLSKVHGDLGNVVATKQTNWQRNFNDKGNFVTISMETRFERGSGQEEFIYRVFDDKLLLAGYHIKWNLGGAPAEAAPSGEKQPEGDRPVPGNST